MFSGYIVIVQGDQRVSLHLMITVQKHAKILMIWRWPSQNAFGIWTVLYWTRSSRTQFDVSINVWRLAGDTLNITCNFLYCNHQVHRLFDHPVPSHLDLLIQMVLSQYVLAWHFYAFLRSHDYSTCRIHLILFVLSLLPIWDAPIAVFPRGWVTGLKIFSRIYE
jgi:hypothetical protein